MLKNALMGISFLFLLTLSACNAEPEVQVDNETTDGEAAGIELTTQVEGEFVRFDGENAVVIKYEGKENTYEIAEDATGDFDIIKEGNSIAFSTKDVDGKEMIETMMLTE
ncbi:MAG: hypothetical protein ABWX61_03270 [Paenisporosarcina sp.]